MISVLAWQRLGWQPLFSTTNKIGSGKELVSNTEEVEAAESKMNAASDALLSYIKGAGAIDHDRHGRLVAQLKKAQAEFLKAISELND